MAPSTHDTPVIIVDPSGREWPLTLDNRPALRRLLPEIADHIFLPREPTYQLIEIPTQRVLDPNRSCAAQSVRDHTSFRLTPIDDQKLQQTLSQLRQEAEMLRRHHLPIEADGRLATLRRLQPDYIDYELRAFASATSYGSASAAAAYATTTRVTVPEESREVIRPTSDTADNYHGTIIVLLVMALLAVAWFIFGTRNDDNPPQPGPTGGVADLVGTQIAVTARTGDLQFVLLWDAAADLDLHVKDPFGVEVSAANPLARSGGRLLGTDYRACLSQPDAARQEMIVWDGEGAPAGEYEIKVGWVSSCGAVGPVPYVVRVTADGEELGVVPGVLHQVEATSVPAVLTRQP